MRTRAQRLSFLRSLRDAVVGIVALHAGSLDSPEAVLLSGTTAGFSRTPVLPLLIEELHRLETGALPWDVAPAARHLVLPIPAHLSVRVAVTKASQSSNDSANA